MALTRSPLPTRGLIATILLASVTAGLSAQTLVHRLDGSAANDRTGAAVGGGWDVDGDGIPDVIVGIPDNDAGPADSGAAQVCSGASGLPIYFVQGLQSAAHFGSSTALVGDLDGDGQSEFLVGAPLYDTGSTDCGRAYLYSGSSGALIQSFSGS